MTTGIGCRILQVISSKSLHSTSSRAQTGLQQQLEEVTAEKQRLESKLASLSDDRGSVQEQLQEVCNSDLSITAAKQTCPNLGLSNVCDMSGTLNLVCRLSGPSPQHKRL